MTVRPIREIGDPVLRTPCDPVRAFDKDLAAVVRDLEETVDHPGRAGLAGNQIGVGLRVFSYNVDGVIGHLVNPVISERSEETQDDDEGCLSIPGLYAPTVRAMRCVAEGFDVHGEPLRIEGTGLLARCLQHETDHVNGIVFGDRLAARARKKLWAAHEEVADSYPADWPVSPRAESA